MLFGCTKPASETPLPEEAAYHGKLSVIEIGDALYEQENVKVSYDLDDRTVDISLYDVSFSSKMPVKLAVVVLEDIPFTKQGYLPLYNKAIPARMHQFGTVIEAFRTDIKLGTI